MTSTLEFSHTSIINKLFIIIVCTLMLIYVLLIVYLIMPSNRMPNAGEKTGFSGKRRNLMGKI